MCADAENYYVTWELPSPPFDRYAHARSIPDNNETGHATDEQTNIERIQVQTGLKVERTLEMISQIAT